jgi:hypothetical protein
MHPNALVQCKHCGYDHNQQIGAQRKVGWLFTVLRPAQEFFTCIENVTIAGEGLQNLGLCSALALQNLGLCSAFRAFEQGGIFIVPHLL